MSVEDTSSSVDPLVVMQDVDVFYDTSQAVIDVSLSIPKGTVTAIIGPNGSGKTTLLDCLAGFKSFDGEITLGGDSVADMDPSDIGGRVGYSTEDGNLFGDMTVEENLQLGSYSNTESTAALEARVYEIFPRLEERRSQEAKTLSGGEQQMLSIGRSLMTDPELLVLDEPSLGLAPVIIGDISDALHKIEQEDITILLAEQNVNLALDHADVVYLLEYGEIRTHGTPDELADDERIRESYFGS